MSSRDKFITICFLTAFGLLFVLLGAAVVMSVRAYPAQLGTLPVAWRVFAGVDLFAYAALIVAIVTNPNRTVELKPRPSWREAARLAVWYWLGICAGQILTFSISRKTDQLWLTVGLMPFAYLVLLVGIRWIRPRGPKSGAHPEG